MLLNGRFYRENDPVFSGVDIFRLNSGAKGSFRAENNMVMFARDNYNYLANMLLSMGLPLPRDWGLPRFERDVSRLLNKNHFYLAAKVSILFFPGSSETNYLLTAEELPGGFYPVNEAGMLTDFYLEGHKGATPHSAYEPASRFLWATASRIASLSSKGNLILLNSKGWACETIGGSFGYIVDKKAVFPSAGSYGYTPPILLTVMGCARESGFEIVEKEDIGREDLLNANELFLIDNCLGVQLVLGLGNERYYTTNSTSIALKLRDMAKMGLRGA